MTDSMAVASDAPNAMVNAIMAILPFWRNRTPFTILKNICPPP